MRLTELAAWAEGLDPVFHEQTDAGFVCLLAWPDGWAIGVGIDAETSLRSAQANALATRMQRP